MQTIFLLIAILIVLVLVHELGHFLTAIKNGVKADEFGFGLPPRIIGWVKGGRGKFKIIWGNKNIKSPFTVFSINWIPLGGFVKIKGEDGEEKKDKDSFASQSAWVRIKILAAGVIMNFLLAWVLFVVVFTLGAPEAINDNVLNNSAKVQITQVVPNSPAEKADLKIGDQILEARTNEEIKKVSRVKDVQDFIDQHKGKTVILKIKRGNQFLEKKVIPRTHPPQGEGATGIALVRTALVKYPWYQAVYKGLLAMLSASWLIFGFLITLIQKLFSGVSVANQVAGPVGIAYMTKEVSSLGLVYLLQFTAILSVNLGIINILPFPALDGGRILFILIEKIKGKPISQKVEAITHNLGFALLITLMIVVTFNDFARYHIIDKIKHLF